MEKSCFFSLFCFLSVLSITDQSLDVITESEVVLALPGTDMTLVCIFPKPQNTYIIQTQWSKTDDSQSTKIAVCHHIYDTHYSKFSEASYNFLVSFSTRKCCDQDVREPLCSTNPNTTSECNQWTLHLKNITVSLSGQYECSFTTYPYGTNAAKIQLIVKAEAYPKISVILQEGSVGTSQKLSVICVVRKAFPKPTLLWYMDGVNLVEQPGDNTSNEASSEAFTTTVSEEPQSTSLASLDVTSLANLVPASITQGNLSYSLTDQTTPVTRGKYFFTTSSLLNGTGDGRNTKASHFPWPTVEAVLLLFCSSLIAVGIRKWCQYQKEIMNRPPSFKPPPPPVKYTSMVESDGTPPSCHEPENL